MTTRPIPPALEPYLRLPPEASLILLTGTLGCSVNWLTCRFISAALSQSLTNEEDAEDTRRPVVLISWLRDLLFWKPEIKRTTGLDITRHPKHFSFIDAFTSPLSLSSLFQQLPTTTSSTLKPLLILDTPTLHLATFPNDLVTLTTTLLHLRCKCHSTVLTTNIDLPLLGTTSPLEVATANFLTTQAHAARLVMGVRELETGAARDVSGVLRATRGGAWDDDEGDAEVVGEKELLYLVQRDGNVRVFNRGEE